MNLIWIDLRNKLVCDDKHGKNDQINQNFRLYMVSKTQALEGH